MGGLQAKSMTSQRATYKMADMRYYGNVMTTTRWRLYVTMETLWQQKNITSTVYDCTVEDVEYIYNKFSIHIQQQKYSHRLNLLYIYFSKILDSSGRNLMDLYDVTSVGFLSGLAIIVICPIFEWQGKYSSLKIALCICVISRRPFLGSSLRSFPVMRSYPGALVGWASR